jgi:hypothetical protein
MTLFTQWEIELLSTLLTQYESGDFNCGASEKELKKVGCPKFESDDVFFQLPCNNCVYRKRFQRLDNKINSRRERGNKIE